MIWLTLSLIAVGSVVAIPATWLARAVGRRVQALDGAGVPGQVKAAPRRVPNTGGVGIFLGVTLPAAAVLAAIWAGVFPMDSFPALSEHIRGLREVLGKAGLVLGCVLVLHITGLVDDRRPLGAMPKLLIMLVVAAIAVVATDSRLLTAVDSIAGGRWLSIALTVLWISVVTNAFNFLDNMDGLAGGVGAICAGGFLATALLASPPQWFIAAMLALLLGALLGFLVFNFPFRARTSPSGGPVTGGASIFMGDGGSLVIGFLLAYLSVRITYVAATPAQGPATESRWHLPLTPLIILAVPLYDFCSVTLIRVSQGKSPFVGDLQHFSHRLVRHGLSPRAAVLIVYGCAAVTCIGGLAMPRLEPWQGVLVGVQTLLVLGVLAGYEWARAPSP